MLPEVGGRQDFVDSRSRLTTNVSQRIGGRLVHRPVPVTFNMSQLGCAPERCAGKFAVVFPEGGG